MTTWHPKSNFLSVNKGLLICLGLGALAVAGVFGAVRTLEDPQTQYFLLNASRVTDLIGDSGPHAQSVPILRINEKTGEVSVKAEYVCDPPVEYFTISSKGKRIYDSRTHGAMPAGAITQVIKPEELEGKLETGNADLSVKFGCLMFPKTVKCKVESE